MATGEFFSNASRTGFCSLWVSWLSVRVPSRSCRGSAKTSSRGDAGQIKLHMRAATATRIEKLRRWCDVERIIHEEIPAGEIESVIDNIGLPYSAYNYTYSTLRSHRAEDADIMISLSQNHRPSDEYIHDCACGWRRNFPAFCFTFRRRTSSAKS